MRSLQEIVEIYKERQLAMIELSQVLGIDISFTDEELEQYVFDAANEFVKKEVMKWMKSL